MEYYALKVYIETGDKNRAKAQKMTKKYFLAKSRDRTFDHFCFEICVQPIRNVLLVLVSSVFVLSIFALLRIS